MHSAHFAARLTAQGDRQAAGLYGPATVSELLDAIGRRQGLAASLDPLIRLVHDRPGKLAIAPHPEQQRIEAALLALGSDAIPELAAAFDHPDLRVRQSVVRVLARHGAAGVEPLLAGLENPLTRLAASEALAGLGALAAGPLAALLASPVTGRPAWHAADAALSAITAGPTYREVQTLRSQLFAAWILPPLVALLLFGVGVWAGLDRLPALILGLGCGLVCWAVAVVGEDGDRCEGWPGFRALLRQLLSAPREYPCKVRRLAALAARRKEHAVHFHLPH